MKRRISKSWLASAQAGFVTAEISLLSAMMVTGAGVGWLSLRDAQTAEIADLAEAVGAVDQSYSYRGLRAGHGGASVAGSSFRDTPDSGDGQRVQYLPSREVEGQGRP